MKENEFHFLVGAWLLENDGRRSSSYHCVVTRQGSNQLQSPLMEALWNTPSQTAIDEHFSYPAIANVDGMIYGMIYAAGTQRGTLQIFGDGFGFLMIR